MSNVTKLTASNFLMWSRQIQALLNGYSLAGYLNGTITVPSQTITTAEVVTVNPAYTAYQRFYISHNPADPCHNKHLCGNLGETIINLR